MGRNSIQSVCLILFVVGMIAATSAGASENANVYYDQMNALANKAKANPQDKTSLHQLEDFTGNPDFWTRAYAYSFLFRLAVENGGGYQAEILPFFDKALQDPEQAIRRGAVQGIVEVGSIAAEREMPLLVKIVNKGEEDDVTRYSAQALGRLENHDKMLDALPVLLAAASKPPPPETQPAAPQVRYHALESINQLAKKSGIKPIPELEAIMDSSVSPYKERVARLIEELDPANGAAQGVLHPKQH